MEKNKRRLFAACTTALALAACGGGSDAPPAPTPPAAESLQGLWQTQSADGATTTSAMALPDGRLWLVTVTNASGVARLVKATLSGSSAAALSGNGRRHLLDGSASAPVAAGVTANAQAKTSLSGSVSPAGGASEVFNLAYLARYDTPALLADHAGAWNATLGLGVVNWTVSATGAISGSRTTGCTYTGQLSTRAEAKAIVEVAVNENCAGAVTQLAGVGALSADKARLSLFLTSAGEANAAVLSLAR